MSTSKKAAVTLLKTPKPASASSKSHHVGDPPTSFHNPWPSFQPHGGLFNIFKVRFSPNRNFVPVPGREELVRIRTPDWGAGKTGLKATWIGHATFLVETAKRHDAERGVRVLFDPVFSDKTGPYGMVGPKRYTPTPCQLEELPEVDAVAISHNHYDHLDLDTLSRINARQNGNLQVLCALGNKAVVVSSGVLESHVTELDWWDGVELEVQDVGSAKLICTPAQHASGRGPFDMGKGLWCSWVLQETSDGAGPAPQRLYFAGDTAYRTVQDGMTPEEVDKVPRCPAFKEIGEEYGPFDLALLPIGLYSPRHFCSPVHCAPEDSVCVHRDIRSKKSIGMHWGTVRGGISGQYEEVREPPRRWKEACEKDGLTWGEEVGLCDVGETICVESVCDEAAE